MILGIDEVGRGSWAGPLVVGAVVLGGASIDGLTDSKKLNKKRREELDRCIRESAAGYGIGWVSAVEIDELGLSKALKLATVRAVAQIHVPYHEIIIDGTVNFLADTKKGEYVTTMKKADLLVPSVSAASIIAKVARDRYMAEQDAVYEGYKFSSHVGYGTAVHREAIEMNGVTPLHRLSFAPLAKYRRSDNYEAATVNEVAHTPSNHMGAIAEDLAAEHLVRLGHRIIDRNWKKKYCEIDIVSSHNDVFYFTEVKYRKSDTQGSGKQMITPKKIKQMTFAANMYIQSAHIEGQDAVLAGASMTGDPPYVEEWLVIESA
jgi:ribonuclease HII